MNLIEQLGGYLVAKEWLDANEHEVKHGYLKDYRYELLEYRRQHNIFENGDKIIYPWLGNEICTYSDSFIIKSPFRHATPAEIQAGKGLD